MSDETLDRRQFFKRAAIIGATAYGAMALVGCEPSAEDAGPEQAPAEPGAGDQAGAAADDETLDCSDAAELSEQEKKTRASLQYTDDSPKPDQHCDNCNLYKEPEEAGACGGCQVLPGPVAPGGWCTAWVLEQPS